MRHSPNWISGFLRYKTNEKAQKLKKNCIICDLQYTDDMVLNEHHRYINDILKWIDFTQK